MPPGPSPDETQAPPDTDEPLWPGVSPSRPTAPGAERPDSAFEAPSGARYQVLGEIARGGIGRVLEAYDRELRRNVALKELLRDTAGNRARFRREILFTARLQHPAIVPLYEVVATPDGRERYAMRLVSGRTLEAAANAAPTIEERLALLPHVVTVADALAYAHTRGVVHRDVKPQNVLIGEFGETVLIDWGVARHVGGGAPEAGGDDDDPAQAALTRAGSVVGTPAYMAPEQARGEPAGFSADVYALGGTLYHLLAGAPPHGDDAVRTLDALIGGRTPPPLEHRAPGVPDDLVSIVRRAMDPDPTRRYPSARELAADLHRFSTGQLVAARRYTRADLLRRWLARHRTLVSVVTAAALLLFTVGGVSAQRVVEERDAAEAARAVAQARANALVLVQARRAAPDDPTEAAAWLAQYPPDAPDWDAVFLLTQDVESRGPATVAVRDDPDGCDTLAWSADGRTVYPAAARTTPVDAATGVRLATIDLPRVERLAALAQGDSIAVSGAGHLSRFDASGLSTRLGELGASPSALVVTGRTALLGDRSGRVTRLDVDTGARSLVPLGEGLVSGLVVDGPRWVATVVDGGVWTGPVAGGAPTLRWRHPTSVEHLVRAGGDLLLGDGAGDVLALGPTGPPRALLHLPGPVAHLAASTDGRFVAAAEGVAALTVLDRELGRTYTPPWPASRVIGLAFVPGDDALAVTLQDGTLRLWRPRTGDVATRRATPALHAAAGFRDDGTAFASCAVDGSLRVWRTPALGATRLPGHEDRVFHVAFLGDGTVVSDSDDRTVRSWAPDGATDVVRAHEDRVYGLAVSPDGRRVASAGLEGLATVWTPGGSPPTLLRRAGGRVHRTAWLPDGERLVTASADGVLALWTADGELVRQVQAHQGTAWWVVVSPDGRLAWSVGADRALRRWDLETGALTTAAEALGRPGRETLRVHLLGDGRVVSCEAGVGFVVVGPDGLRRVPYPGAGACTSMVVSPDGHTLAVPDGASVGLFDVDTGVLRPLLTMEAEVHSVTFSPDGHLLATAGLDGTARVWRIADGAGYIAWRAEGPVIGIAFSDDGARLAAGGVDPTVWTAPVDEAAFVPRDPVALRARVLALTTAAAPG